MKSLLLVTQGFPYGESEQGFLPAEYEALRRHFHLRVLAFDNGGTPNHPLSPDVRYDRYTWPARRSFLGLLRQLRYAEVRADIRAALSAQGPKRLKRAVRILTYSLRAEQTMPRLRRLVAEQKTDILYTYWGVQATVAAIWLKDEFPALKVISRFHGADLYLNRTGENWQPLRPYIAKGCDQLLFVSQNGMDYFLREWGIQWRAKARVAYLGCGALPRSQAPGAKEGPLVLTSCSSLIPIKRVSLIIEALALLPAEIPVHWHHLGEGELRPALEAKARTLLANRPHIRYTFHGQVPHGALGETYLRIGAELLITTSETEGLPVSMMEAFAMGIPVIATAVGGIPEMLEDGKSGFLLSPNPAPEEVAAAIQRHVSLPEEAQRELSQNAWAYWQAHLNAEKNAEDLMEVLAAK